MVQAGASYRSVFAVREFRWLWLAHILSVAGDQLARIALTVLVFDRTASTGLAALTYALTYLPDLVGGAALAGLADRFPRRTVMVSADLARAVLVAVMALPVVPLLGKVVLLVLVQLLAAPFSAARQAVLSDVLAGDGLVVGLGLISMTYQAGMAIGFGAGAAAVTWLGPSGALTIDAVTFAMSALAIGLRLRPHKPAARSGPRPHPAWRLVLGDARLRVLLAIACCSGFYVLPEGLAVPYSVQLGAGTAGAGWLLAANPVGSVLGVVLLKLVPPGRRLLSLGPLAVATSFVLLPTAWVTSLAVSVLLWMLSGAFSAHDMVTQAAYVTSVPAERRAQAVGVAIAALRAAQGIGIVCGGLLAQVFPTAAVITGAAGAGVLVAAVAARGWSRAAGGSTG